MSAPGQPAAPDLIFNTPPGWPPTAPGWVPPPGWQPDPSWPPAPEGWQWWVPKAQAQAPGGMAAGARPVADVHGLASRARNLYLGGVAVTIAAAVTTLLAAKKGGTVWTGGFLVGAVLWVRAGVSALTLRRSGQRLSRRAVAVVVVTAPLTLALAGVAVADLVHMHNERPASHDPDRNSVGSCYARRGTGQVLHVACSAGDATLIASSRTTDPAQCPTGYVTRTGYYLCLSTR